ncbi:hypothetical protein BDA96_10G083000 [Sorghum bicolor]|uniref:Cytochrome P450 n=1 Tax=Sorghum bicolor TaxID=4558 RepID=A0A921Q1V7_SORBI|nr:hypothetical protein BDA96_10G083000 [Sorghum bicolor]
MQYIIMAEMRRSLTLSCNSVLITNMLKIKTLYHPEITSYKHSALQHFINQKLHHINIQEFLTNMLKIPFLCWSSFFMVLSSASLQLQNLSSASLQLLKPHGCTSRSSVHGCTRPVTENTTTSRSSAIHGCTSCCRRKAVQHCGWTGSARQRWTGGPPQQSSAGSARPGRPGRPRRSWARRGRAGRRGRARSWPGSGRAGRTWAAAADERIGIWAGSQLHRRPFIREKTKPSPCSQYQRPVAQWLINLQVTMVLYETLRLYGPVNTIVRQTTTDVDLCGVKVPKGTHLAIPFAMLHRDEEVWGADAGEFDPLRFRDTAWAGRRRRLAFSLGQRSCIGKDFAMLEAKVTLALIVQRFAFEVAPEYVHAPAALLTVQPSKGLPVVLRLLEAHTLAS